MTLAQLAPPYPIFTDKSGLPLDNGYLYFGTANLNSETNPITVYYDRGFTQPAAQPLRTSAGYVMRNGSPAAIYANSQFSVTVRDKKKALVIYSPVGFGITPGVPFATFDNAANNVTQLLENTTFTYSAGVPNSIQVAAGDILRTLAEGFAYAVAASGVTDQHVTTAGGVKLYVQGGSSGYNVKAFGAAGDGTTDDTTAIKIAISASQVVYFPSGQYRITSSIAWQNQWLIGSVDNGELSTSNNQTMIIADGTFAAFKYTNPLGFNAQGGGIKNFNIYFANGAVPLSASERPNAIGVYIASTGGYPAFCSFENISVRGGMWAIFDASASWMVAYKHINSQHNFAGFYKNGGTTVSFENCYHQGGKAGFNIVNCLGVSVDASAADLVETDLSGYCPIYVENSQVHFCGCDFEGNKVNANKTQVVLASGENTLVSFDACAFYGVDVASFTETYAIHSTNGAKIELSNCNFSPTTYTGSGGQFSYLTATAFGKITASNILLPSLSGTGSPSTVYATLPKGSGSSITFHDVVTPYAFYGRSLLAEKSIFFSTTHNFPSVANGSYTSQDFTILGAEVGDMAIADVVVANPAGLFFNAHVKSSDTVTVSVFNFSGAINDLAPAQVDVRILAKL